METERDLVLPTDAEGAWELLTRPEDLAGWLGEVTFEASPGSTGTLVEHDGTRRRVLVDAVQAGQRLSWWWWDDDGGEGEPTHVEVTLAPAAGGTRLRVVEQPLPGAPAVRARAHQASEAWSHRLLHLEALLLVAAAVRG